MSNTHLNQPRTTSTDEEIIIDQEVRHADGTVRRRRETLRSDDPAVEERIERARLQTERQLQIRDNDNAARGLLVGIIATTFLGLGILAWYLFTNNQNTEVTPVVVPAQPSEPSTPPDINITLPNPPAAESTTETAPTQPTIIQTQPAPPQPLPSTPPTSEVAPAINSESTAPEPANSAAPNEPTSNEPTSPAPAESSTTAP